MKSKTASCKYLGFCLLIAFLAGAGRGVPANAGHQAQEPSSKPVITTSVNERPPASGVTIVSGSIVQTTNVTGLLVNLRKAGRVELSQNSGIKLSYGENSITGALFAGRVRVATPAGVSTSISTADGEVVVNEGAATSLTIDIECGNTVVKVKNGEVELRAGGEVKKISAGEQGSVGTPLPVKKCSK
jgi:formylmethanofuran dehydrogenase subunit C